MLYSGKTESGRLAQSSIIFFLLLFAAACGGGGGGSSSSGSSASQTAYNSDDVAGKAISSQGSNVEASTAILMSLARGNTITQVVTAIMAGTMDANGAISSSTARASSIARASSVAISSARLSDLCTSPEDEKECNKEIDQRLAAWENQGGGERIAGMILRAGARGYSADQITAAIVASLLRINQASITSKGEIYTCIDYNDAKKRCDDEQTNYLTPSSSFAAIFTDVDASDGDSGSSGGSSSGGDTSSGGSSKIWIAGTWNSSGSARFSDGSRGSSNGTFTFNADGTYVNTYNWSNTDGKSGNVTLSNSWTLNGSALTTPRGTGSCSGQAPENASKIVLACTNEWTITLTR